MNKNEFIKNLDSKDIISLIEKEGTKELIFTEKNNVVNIESRHHHNNLLLNSLDDFIHICEGEKKQAIYSFKENKIYCIEEVEMQMNKKSLKVHSFLPINTEEMSYWSKQGESNLKKFLNKLALVADKDQVRSMRLSFAEFEIGEKVDARNDSVVVKTIKNTLKSLPEVLTIRFKPYMFVDDFQIEMEIYLEWELGSEGFEGVKWDFEVSLVKNLFYEHLSSETELAFVIGDFVAVNENYVIGLNLGECKEEAKEIEQ